MPRPVRFARGLLYFQGVIWAGGAFMFAIWTVAAGIMALAGDDHVVRSGGVIFLPVAVVAGGLGAAKFFLARKLAARGARTREIAIGVEIAMACLGALMTAGANLSGGLPADLFTLAAFVGGVLSLVAALGLLRRPARQFSAEPGPAVSPAPDSDSRTAFSAPISILRRYRVLLPA